MFKSICSILTEVATSLFANNAGYNTNESSDIYDSVYTLIKSESYDNIQYLLENNMTLNRYKDSLYSNNKETMARDIAQFCSDRNMLITSYRDR